MDFSIIVHERLKKGWAGWPLTNFKKLFKIRKNKRFPTLQQVVNCYSST